MDKQTVLEVCNRVADLADLPFYTELIDALRAAMIALTSSSPNLEDAQFAARHTKAIRDVKSCIKRFDQDVA
jgi:hypothetical protein